MGIRSGVLQQQRGVGSVLWRVFAWFVVDSVLVEKLLLW